MKNRLAFVILFITVSVGYSQVDKPFQVLGAKGATIGGFDVEPLQLVDDVTSIEVQEGGFISLVHEGGTTYEKKEKVFTFYLKPEELKNFSERPKLEILYEKDSIGLDQSKMVQVLYPPFDRSGFAVCNKNQPLEIFWHLYDEPVINYVISVNSNAGSKIQDFRTSRHNHVLKPNTYGLSDDVFNFKVKSTFAGKTIESKTHTVELKEAKNYPEKASDLVVKALYLEANTDMALTIWQEVFAKPNGDFYWPLFENFLLRNETILTESGKDVKQLLSQSK